MPSRRTFAKTVALSVVTSRTRSRSQSPILSDLRELFGAIARTELDRGTDLAPRNALSRFRRFRIGQRGV